MTKHGFLFRLGAIKIALLLPWILLSTSPAWATDSSDSTLPSATNQEINETQPIDAESFWKEKFDFRGVLRQETAFRVGSPKDFSKIKQYVELNFKFLFNDTIHLKFGGRAWYDAIYDLTDQFPSDVDNQMKKEVALRDAYIDIYAKNVQIRLGHQQIVWGDALALFVADVVNPKDLREFILPPFDYVRLPIWSLDLRWFFLSNATLEIVATPDQTISKLALPGADFSFFPAPNQTFTVGPLLPGVPIEVLSEKAPASFKNWNGGGRITFLAHGWDFSWLYYNTISHLPGIFKTLAIDTTTGHPVLLLNPVHQRQQDFGFTFTKGVKSSILRGEFVFTKNVLFNSNDVLFNQGVTKGNLFSYVIGFDTTLGGKVDMISEFQQQVVVGDTSNISKPSVDSWIALRFETGFLDETLIPEIVFVVGLRKGDTLIRPRINFLVTDSIMLSWGADIFTGPRDTLYGQFRDSSRIYMDTQWSF